MQSKRINKLRQYLDNIKADAVIINNPENVYYLSGFTGYGDGSLLISCDEAYLFTDSRYEIQASCEAPLFEVKMMRVPSGEEFIQFVKSKKYNVIAFEDDYVSYSFWKVLNDKFSFCKIINLGEILSDLRMIKDEHEINLIKKACEIAGDAFLEMKNLIVPGVTENDIAAELEFRMKKRGSSKTSFDTIIASGYRAAMPHGTASDKRILPGESVICDFGAVYNGYCSDMTRTVFTDGKVDNKLIEIYDVVKEAHDLAIRSFKIGMTGRELDMIARDYIESFGYVREFGHSLGHGIGVEVHEAPSVSRVYKKVLEKGMVFSIEPGVYLEGLGGVRIEDLVLVTDSGLEVITKG